MKYEDLVKAIKEDEEWENRVEEYVQENEEKIKRIRHGKDLDALDGVF